MLTLCLHVRRGKGREFDPQTALGKYLLSDHFLQGFRLECGREACLWREAARRSKLEAGTGLHQELSEPGEPWEAKAFPRHRVHRTLRQKDYYESEYNLGNIVSSGAPAWVL